MKLELKNIDKNFGEKQVLRGVSFSAESGRACGLLGRNGAGKTTSIRILMNVFPANGGEVLIDGKPIDYNRVGFGYLPEERGLYPKKKIIDQLIYFAELKGMGRSDAVRSVDHWLGRLGMTEYRNRRLDTLSKGNQQKIQLVTALAHDPEIIILDEPFSGLDPVNARLLKDIVKEEIEKGKILLFSSHQMNYIEEFCDSIAILNGGRVVLAGDLHEIKRNYPRTRLVVETEHPEALLRDTEFHSKQIGAREVMIQMNAPEDKRRVMQALAVGHDVEGIRVFEPSLNDIFVEYAEEDQ